MGSFITLPHLLSWSSMAGIKHYQCHKKPPRILIFRDDRRHSTVSPNFLNCLRTRNQDALSSDKAAKSIHKNPKLAALRQLDFCS